MIPHFALKHHPQPLTKYEGKGKKSAIFKILKKSTIFRILVNWG